MWNQNNLIKLCKRDMNLGLDIAKNALEVKWLEDGRSKETI